MKRKSPNARKPDRQAIIRAVASSTAIETGKPIRQLETLLRNGNTSARLRALVLAK